jgi:hypothetical protein
MEKVGQLYLLIKVLILFLFSFLVAGCSKNALELPHDYSSIDATEKLYVEDFDVKIARLSCSEINKELKILESANKANAQTIQNNRSKNQAATYIGSILFLPAYLGLDNDSNAKEKIDTINNAKDELYKLQILKNCSASVSVNSI